MRHSPPDTLAPRIHAGLQALSAKRNEAQGSTAVEEEPAYGLVRAGVRPSEALVEVDMRHRFSVLGLDGVLELGFQIGNRQFTEKREVL